jgi:type I restriction enzyme M protein
MGFRDKNRTDLDNLPEPDELADAIIENLKASLGSFREVLAGLDSATKFCVELWRER